MKEIIKVIEKKVSLNSNATFFLDDLKQEVREQIKKEFNIDILPNAIREMPENHTTSKGKFFFFFRIKIDLKPKRSIKTVAMRGMMPPLSRN